MADVLVRHRRRAPDADPTPACTATGLPAGLAIDPDGTITGTMSSLGIHTVTITAPDAGGEACTATFDWIVL